MSSEPSVKVSKAQFLRYERVRLIGRFNMFDPRARRETGLSSETYSAIIWNYTELAEKYAIALAALRGEVAK